MFRRVTWVLLLACAVLAILPAATALAATQPQMSAVVLRNYTFESNTVLDSGDYYSFNTYRTAPGGDYWWGRSAGHGRTGVGLWCAGSNLSGLAAAVWPNLKAASRTAGEADFALDNTSGWYKSEFSFWYIFPSGINIFTESPLTLQWYDTKNPRTQGADVPLVGGYMPLRASWTQVVEKRSGGTPAFPAVAGTMKIQYVDDTFPYGGGQGATVDDVQLTGYKYGPARNFSAVRSATTSTTINLAWDAPYQAEPPNTTVDTRSIAYHAWRKDLSTGLYTELTPPAPTTAGHVAISDTSAPVDKAILYVVQAFDPADQATKWGEAKTSAAIGGVVPNMQPVWRFRNIKSGYYLWSANVGEKDNIVNTMKSIWTLEGEAYSINIANLDNSAPLYRFRNNKGGFYLYTANEGERDNIVNTMKATWTLEGPAYNVSNNPVGGDPVWRFRNVKNGTYLLTGVQSEKDNIVNTMKATWTLEGPAFYIAKP